MKRKKPSMNGDCSSPSFKRANTVLVAQRKFAQGTFNFVSSSIMQSKVQEDVECSTKPPDCSSRDVEDEGDERNSQQEFNAEIPLPSTEDFLTFLCFRGTRHLPERLNFFNIPQKFQNYKNQKTDHKFNCHKVTQENGLRNERREEEICEMAAKQHQQQETKKNGFVPRPAPRFAKILANCIITDREDTKKTPPSKKAANGFKPNNLDGKKILFPSNGKKTLLIEKAEEPEVEVAPVRPRRRASRQLYSDNDWIVDLLSYETEEEEEEVEEEEEEEEDEEEEKEKEKEEKSKDEEGLAEKRVTRSESRKLSCSDAMLDVNLAGLNKVEKPVENGILPSKDCFIMCEGSNDSATSSSCKTYNSDLSFSAIKHIIGIEEDDGKSNESTSSSCSTFMAKTFFPSPTKSISPVKSSYLSPQHSSGEKPRKIFLVKSPDKRDGDGEGEEKRKGDAFDVKNEKSVYAFEPDLPPSSMPFRKTKSADEKGRDIGECSGVVHSSPKSGKDMRETKREEVGKKKAVAVKCEISLKPERMIRSKSVKQVGKELKEKDVPCELLEAPTFYPMEEEFNDPVEYINKIQPLAEKYGICRIVPPPSFKPDCQVEDEMRFLSYNQYVHKMLNRWGPNVREMIAIKKHLQSEEINLSYPPWIAGMEVDLPRLYKTVQQCGGLNEVIEQDKWNEVADLMKIPKSAQDRITKIDALYLKYLVSYEMMSKEERAKLLDEVDKEYNTRVKNKTMDEEDSAFSDVEECITKGRTMPLSTFYRIARNTMAMWFGGWNRGEAPSTEIIEKEFWKHVSDRKTHVCVHSGSIDSGTQGYGFSVAKNSNFRKHPWNLKILTNNAANVLRTLGPIIGSTVPTIHVGMLYSSCCWYRDPHSLPWIEYLHTGANKIWYGVPDEYSNSFKEAMVVLVPRCCQDKNKKIWLATDTAMIPPDMLLKRKVPLTRVVQQPGEYVVVFPKAFTANVSTGYIVSESVYFAPPSWLDSAEQIFKDMQESCEPSVFSLEELLIGIATDIRSSLEVLQKVLPLLQSVRDTEMALRDQLEELGVEASERLFIKRKRKLRGSANDDENYECEICRANLFVSLVINSHEQSHYCLRDAANFLYKRQSQAKYCKLMYAYTQEELESIISKVEERIATKSQKKPYSFSRKSY